MRIPRLNIIGLSPNYDAVFLILLRKRQHKLSLCPRSPCFYRNLSRDSSTRILSDGLQDVLRIQWRIIKNGPLSANNSQTHTLRNRYLETLAESLYIRPKPKIQIRKGNLNLIQVRSCLIENQLQIKHVNPAVITDRIFISR